ncbi:MAG TPA: hypothetical protein VK178_17795, partial [Opitutaceae bacterium]|nr:hypothetical protein [Opitutaceae bacterium]
YWTGLPLALRPLSVSDVAIQRLNSVRLVEVNHDEVVGHRAIRLVQGRGAAQAPAKDLFEVLEKLFGPLR